MGSEKPVYEQILFRSFKVISDGLHLKSVDGSTCFWEYYLPMQHYGNTYSYSISNEIYQQFTQHIAGHSRYKIEGKQYTTKNYENGL